MIEFEGAIDRDLYIKALRRQGASPLWLGVMLFAVGICGVISTAGTLRWTVPLLLLGLGLFLLVLPYWYTRQAFRTSSILGQAFTGHVDASEFVAESPHGRSNIQWAAFHRAMLTPDLVLLYVSSQQFYILSRRFFKSDADWSELQAIVAGHVRLKKPAQSALQAGLLWFAIVVSAFIVWTLLQAYRS
jgi:hypothetical protein